MTLKLISLENDTFALVGTFLFLIFERREELSNIPVLKKFILNYSRPFREPTVLMKGLARGSCFDNICGCFRSPLVIHYTKLKIHTIKTTI